jgi:hypothetical protein
MHDSRTDESGVDATFDEIPRNSQANPSRPQCDVDAPFKRRVNSGASLNTATISCGEAGIQAETVAVGGNEAVL